MDKKEVIVVGGSAGSINVMLKILPLLAKDSCLPVILVIHRKATDGNTLETILQLKSRIKVREVEDKMPITANTIFLAPANYHLLAEKDKTFMLDYSEKINFSRPNIDICMESLVDVYGEKVIGILLTGANDDGAIGMKKIKDAGGYTIIQSPDSCLFPMMPEHAEKLFKPDLKLKPEEIAGFIMNLKN